LIPTTPRSQGTTPLQPGTVTGRVELDGEPPQPRSYNLDEIMQKATGQKTYADETWLVGTDHGLANCVVILKAKDSATRPPPKPLDKAIIVKEGVRFVPRVLAVTPGTTVVMRNLKSPCRGFECAGRFHQFSDIVWEGKETKESFTRADVCRLSCGVRPYATGYVYVVDSSYFAVTDRDGRFQIADVLPGEYLATVWHEAVGRLGKNAGPDVLKVNGRDETAVSYRVKVPAKER
jgi:hypothetical protein